MKTRKQLLMIAAMFAVAVGIPAHADEAKVDKSGSEVGVVSIHVDKDGAGESDVQIDDGSGDPVKEVSVYIPLKVGGKDVPKPTCTGCTVQQSSGKWQLTWSVGSSTNTPINKTFKTSNLTIGTPVDVKITYKDDSSSYSDDLKYQRFKTEQSGKKVIDTTAKKTILFNSATGVLTMENDFVTNTGFAKDPLLGASVTLPQYRLVGPTGNPNFVEFALAGDNMWLQMNDAKGETLLRANAPFLYYDIAKNQFYAGMDLLELSGSAPGTPFYSPGVATVSSPSLNALASELNPDGASFLGSYPLGSEFVPDTNFYLDTNGFTSDGSSGFVDHFIVGTPEPGSLFLLGSGVLSLGGFLRKQMRTRT